MTEAEYRQRLDDMNDLKGEDLRKDLLENSRLLLKEQGKIELAKKDKLPNFLILKLKANEARLLETKYLIQSLMAYRETKKNS